MSALRLLFVDDHPVIATGLAAHFAALPGVVVVGTVATAADALDVVARGGVDVAVVDVGLGVPLTPRQVTALCAHARVVLFSARVHDPIVAQLVAAGAAAVVDKAAPLAVLEQVARDVAAGRVPTSTLTSSSSTSTGPEQRLSEREREVFFALARCQTPKEVAASLGIAPTTVYSHIDRIRQKLGVTTLQEIVALSLAAR